MHVLFPAYIPINMLNKSCYFSVLNFFATCTGRVIPPPGWVEVGGEEGDLLPLPCFAFVASVLLRDSFSACVPAVLVHTCPLLGWSPEFSFLPRHALEIPGIHLDNWKKWSRHSLGLRSPVLPVCSQSAQAPDPQACSAPAWGGWIAQAALGRLCSPAISNKAAQFIAIFWHGYKSEHLWRDGSWAHLFAFTFMAGRGQCLSPPLL